MAPWTHLHVVPDGTVYPCCKALQPVGRVKNQSLEKVWNSTALRTLRKKMLSGKASPQMCLACYEDEKHALPSLRLEMNEKWRAHQAIVDQTKPDGYLSEFNLVYWDIRFSNLCNFRCRSCRPLWSSALGQEMKLPAEVRLVNLLDRSPITALELWTQLDKVEEIQFAGGESLLQEEHYQLLEQLIAVGRTDVRLSYITNFSNFGWRGVSVLDLWKKFPNVSVTASLDAEGARAEYLRAGTKWSQILTNRQRLVEQCPHVNLKIAPTVSIYNVLHIFDFVENWIQAGWVSPERVSANVLEKPEELSIQNLSGEAKALVLSRAREFARKMEKLFPQGLRQVRPFVQAIVGKIDNPAKRDLKEFVAQANYWDLRRNQDWQHTFPELKRLLGE